MYKAGGEVPSLQSVVRKKEEWDRSNEPLFDTECADDSEMKQTLSTMQSSTSDVHLCLEFVHFNSAPVRPLSLCTNCAPKRVRKWWSADGRGGSMAQPQTACTVDSVFAQRHRHEIICRPFHCCHRTIHRMAIGSETVLHQFHRSIGSDDSPLGLRSTAGTMRLHLPLLQIL